MKASFPKDKRQGCKDRETEAQSSGTWFPSFVRNSRSFKTQVANLLNFYSGNWRDGSVVKGKSYFSKGLVLGTWPPPQMAHKYL